MRTYECNSRCDAEHGVHQLDQYRDNPAELILESELRICTACGRKARPHTGFGAPCSRTNSGAHAFNKPDAGHTSADGNPEGAGDPRPTCEGYAPQAPPLAKGDKVRLTKAVVHFVRHKDIPVGTYGVVQAVRNGDPDGPQALVKFEGFAWPKVVPFKLLERATPVRILTEKEVLDVLKS